MPRPFRCLRCLALLLSLAVPASGAAADRQILRIPRASQPPTIERYLGAGGDPPGVRVEVFVQREPGDGVPASQPTVAYLSYDAHHLYVAFVCHDEAGRVRANLTKREAIDGDDFVGLVLDTYHDGRRAYLFIANPLGIQKDGVSSEGQEDDYSYDALWTSEGRLTADGYVVFLAIPFKSLRFSHDAAQTWGIALARVITRANETSFWPYITRRISSIGQQLATLEGVEGVSPGRNLQAIPYATYTGARFRDEDDLQVTDHTGRAGLDAKAVIRDAITLDLTVNPDFSQVESDEPQVTVNQRFEVFFPEKRPFFIENAGYFETPQTLFFSRRIADPELGFRVTGKGRGWAFGALAINDDQPGRDVPEDDPRRDTRAGIGVVRVQREFGRQSYVGGIFTDRELGPSANRVYGVDGRWRLDDNWSVTGQWVGSHTVDQEEKATSGVSSLVGVSRNGRSFYYSAQAFARSPDFRADLGFIPRVDLLATEHDAGYTWYPTGRRVLGLGPEIEVDVLWDYSGQLQEWIVEPAFEVELPGETELGVRHWRSYERFQGLDFRHETLGAYGSTSWLSWLSLAVFARWGSGINYYPPEGLAPFLADRQEVEASATLRPTPRLRLDQTYLFSRLAAREDVQFPGGGRSGGDIFNNHIARTRAAYQFTRELSARVIVDYEAVLPNESLVSLEREKGLRFDVLGTYLINPWTAVYVGYTDAYDDRLAGGTMQRPSTRAAGPTTPVARQLFVKISYLIRY